MLFIMENRISREFTEHESEYFRVFRDSIGKTVDHFSMNGPERFGGFPNEIEFNGKKYLFRHRNPEKKNAVYHLVIKETDYRQWEDLVVTDGGVVEFHCFTDERDEERRREDYLKRVK